MQNCSAALELDYEKVMEAWPGHFFDSLPSMLVALTSISSMLGHLWLERARLLSLWMAMPSRQHAVSCVCNLRGKRMAREHTEGGFANEKKPLGQNKCSDIVNQKRIDIFYTFCRWISPGAAALMVACYTAFQLEFGYVLQCNEDNFALLNFYILCLLAQFGPWSLSPAKVDILGSAMSFALLLRMIRSTGAANFFAYSNARTAFRLGIGLCTLNHKIQGPWSVLIGLVTAYKNIQLSEQVAGMHAIPALVVVSELFTSSVCWLAYYLVQSWLEEAMSAMLEARSSSSEQSGTKRLLSVLCDGQVTLNANYRIVGDATCFSRILMSQLCAAQATRRYEGANFCDYLAASDKSRFDMFISQGSENDASGSVLAAAPVGSLSVHMVDSAQVKFRVELFHVQFSDLDGAPLHLLGIRDADGRASTPPSSSPASIVHSDRGFEMSTSQASQSASEPGSITRSVLLKSTSREEVGLVAPTITSSNSSGSRTGEHAMATLEFIEIHFDPFTEDFPIGQCNFSFQDLEATEKKQQIPLLTNWIKKDCQRFTDWVRDQVNVLSFGRPPSVPDFGNVKFKMPGRAEMCLVASSCRILVSGEGSLEAGGELSSEDSDFVEVKICMSGFRATRSQSGFGLRRREHSYASARSAGSGGKELPSIKETLTC